MAKVTSQSIKAWLALHREQETAFADELRTVFARQQLTVVQNLNALVGQLSPADAEKILPPGESDRELTSVGRRRVGEAALAGATLAYNRITAAESRLRRRLRKQQIELPPDVRQAIEAHLDTVFAAPYWRQINENSRDSIRRILLAGIESGRSTTQIRDDLIAGLDDLFSPSRFNAIARTETTSALNLGHHFVNQKLANDPNSLVVGKEWVSILDGSVRVSHARADGQKVGANELFTVGGEKARFPGDPALSVAEKVNCRCTMIDVFDESELTDDDGAGVGDELGIGDEMGGEEIVPQPAPQPQPQPVPTPTPKPKPKPKPASKPKLTPVERVATRLDIPADDELKSLFPNSTFEQELRALESSWRLVQDGIIAAEETKWARLGLTPVEYAAMQTYSSWEYRRLNLILRGLAEDVTPEELAFANAMQAVVDRALAKLPPSPGIAYRGFRGESGNTAGLLAASPGDEIADVGFASASASEEIARTFGKNILKIVYQSGRDFSAVVGGEEAEILFRTGTRFRVVSNAPNEYGGQTITVEEIVEN